MGIQVKSIAAGGTPTFPIHCKRNGVEVSPGTSLLWDHQYAMLFPDLNFIPAAVLITRLISKPKKGYLCFDLGHKSVASEMPLPRVKFMNTENFEQVGQSEEHLVVCTENTKKYKMGQAFYTIPMHICPTVTKYNEVMVVENGIVTGVWDVAARNTKIVI